MTAREQATIEILFYCVAISGLMAGIICCFVFLVSRIWQSTTKEYNTAWEISGLVIGSVLFLGILSVALYLSYTYYTNFNVLEETKNNQLWGDFGSLISGLFSPLAAASLLITVYFLNKQIRRQEVMNERQRSALDFELYDKHKSLFKKKLSEIENTLDKKIEFTDTDNLYLKLFPNNDFLKTLKPIELRANLESSELLKGGNFGDIIEIAARIKEGGTLDAYHADYPSLLNIYNLLCMLHLKPNEERKTGDLYLEEKFTGINVYEVGKTISRLDFIIGEITSYAGTRHESKIQHSISDNLYRDSLIKNIIRQKRRNNTFRIHYQLSCERHLDILYSDIVELRGTLKDAYEAVYPYFCKSSVREKFAQSEEYRGNIHTRIYNDIVKNNEEIGREKYLKLQEILINHPHFER